MRILIVEDEVVVAKQIASALTEDGHDPVVVHDGEAALNAVRNASFDLIVLDIRLLESMASRCCNVFVRNISLAAWCCSRRVVQSMTE